MAVTSWLVIVCGTAIGPGLANAEPRPHVAIGTATVGVGCSEGDRGTLSDLLFPPAIAEAEGSLEREEPRTAGPTALSRGDDSTRRGHVAVGHRVDARVLSANAADLCRLCRRLL